jgi:hypothetical protein
MVTPLARLPRQESPRGCEPELFERSGPVR